MAFRILTEEEKAFLDDNELKRYEEQLKVYQMRVDFVNQLEKFENAEIKPYEAKKKAVKVVEKIQVSDVTMPETMVKSENKISEKISEIRLLNKSDSGKYSEGIKPNVSVSNNSEKLYYIVNKCNSVSGIHVSAEIPSVKRDRTNYTAPEVTVNSIPPAEINNIPDNIPAVNQSKVKVNIPETKIGKIDIGEKIPCAGNDIKINMPVSAIENINIAEKIPCAESDIKISMPVSDVGNINLQKDVECESISFTAPEINIGSVSKPVSVPEKTDRIEIPKGAVSVNRKPEITVPETVKFTVPSAMLKVPEIKGAVPVSIKKFEKPDNASSVDAPHVPDVKPVNINMPKASVSGMPEIKVPDSDSNYTKK